MILDRFNQKYRIDQKTGCWNWIAGGRGSGYGCMKIDKKIIDSHRISYELFIGDIPKGMMVCHKCDNRACVNPFHLFSGTGSDNMTDCVNKGRHAMPSEINRNKIKSIITEKYGISIEDKYGNVFESISECSKYYKWKSN